MPQASSLESYYLLTEGTTSNRHLQQELPDYTSPPLPIALELTPELYRDDKVVQESRRLDASKKCSIDGNRCQIPFPPNSQKFSSPSRVGVLFYNGGLVDPRGYSPLAAILNERYGMPVVIPIFANDLAFVFGVCDSGRLDYAKAEFPDVEKWVLAGHSFGGVAAAVDMWNRYNNTNDESAAGLVMLAADVQMGLDCGDTDFSKSNLPMAQVLASNDGILNQTRTNQNRINNSNATHFVEMYGANHASFGAYDSSKRFELFGQVDGEELIPSVIAWDHVSAAIANVAARSGVALPTRKEPMPATSTSGGVGIRTGFYSSSLPFWSIMVYFGCFFFNH